MNFRLRLSFLSEKIHKTNIWKLIFHMISRCAQLSFLINFTRTFLFYVLIDPLKRGKFHGSADNVVTTTMLHGKIRIERSDVPQAIKIYCF